MKTPLLEWKVPVKLKACTMPTHFRNASDMEHVLFTLITQLMVLDLVGDNRQQADYGSQEIRWYSHKVFIKDWMIAQDLRQ